MEFLFEKIWFVTDAANISFLLGLYFLRLGIAGQFGLTVQDKVNFWV